MENNQEQTLYYVKEFICNMAKSQSKHITFLLIHDKEIIYYNCLRDKFDIELKYIVSLMKGIENFNFNEINKEITELAEKVIIATVKEITELAEKAFPTKCVICGIGITPSTWIPSVHDDKCKECEYQHQFRMKQEHHWKYHPFGDITAKLNEKDKL